MHIRLTKEINKTTTKKTVSGRLTTQQERLEPQQVEQPHLPLKRSVEGLLTLGANGGEMVAVVVMMLDGAVEVKSGEGEGEGEGWDGGATEPKQASRE